MNLPGEEGSYIIEDWSKGFAMATPIWLKWFKQNEVVLFCEQNVSISFFGKVGACSINCKTGASPNNYTISIINTTPTNNYLLTMEHKTLIATTHSLDHLNIHQSYFPLMWLLLNAVYLPQRHWLQLLLSRRLILLTIVDVMLWVRLLSALVPLLQRSMCLGVVKRTRRKILINYSLI